MKQDTKGRTQTANNTENQDGPSEIFQIKGRGDFNSRKNWNTPEFLS